jgi:hypothetical protein
MAEEEAFRAEVCRFFGDELPRGIAEKVTSGRRLGSEGIERWQAI